MSTANKPASAMAEYDAMPRECAIVATPLAAAPNKWYVPCSETEKSSESGLAVSSLLAIRHGADGLVTLKNDT